jgi:hypothetical protein
MNQHRTEPFEYLFHTNAAPDFRYEDGTEQETGEMEKKHYDHHLSEAPS